MLFIGTQSVHLVPVKSVERHRIRTGYERTLAHRVGRMFAGIAQDDGRVSSIDEDTKMVEVTYSDGTRDMFYYGQKFTEFQGFHVTQDIVAPVTVGQKLKKGDVVTYNKGYFTQDTQTKQLDYSIGVLANVALMEIDTTLEDSTEISASLADRLTICPTNIRVITLPAKSLIHTAMAVGEEVTPTSRLMIFEEESIGDSSLVSSANEETLALLGDLNKRTPSAKFSGKIVKIEAFYGCPISDMSPTVSTMVRAAIREQNKQHKLTKGTDAELEFPESAPLPEGSKYKGVTFDKNTVVFIYYIQESVPHDKGDKLSFCNQLKCTCAGIFPKPITTESGVPIDALFSCVAVANRIVLSPIYYGITARIMERVEQDAVSMYFADKK